MHARYRPGIQKSLVRAVAKLAVDLVDHALEISD